MVVVLDLTIIPPVAFVGADCGAKPTIVVGCDALLYCVRLIPRGSVVLLLARAPGTGRLASEAFTADATKPAPPPKTEIPLSRGLPPKKSFTRIRGTETVPMMVPIVEMRM